MNEIPVGSILFEGREILLPDYIVDLTGVMKTEQEKRLGGRKVYIFALGLGYNINEALGAENEEVVHALADTNPAGCRFYSLYQGGKFIGFQCDPVGPRSVEEEIRIVSAPGPKGMGLTDRFYLDLLKRLSEDDG